MKRFRKCVTCIVCVLIFCFSVSTVYAEGILSGRRVIIDAGHGGAESPGKTATLNGRVITERDLNMSLALKVAYFLKNMGAEVVYTRQPNTYVFVGLDERVSIANASGADIFVSIHHNSFTDPGASGVESWYSSYRAYSGDSAEIKLLATRSSQLATSVVNHLASLGFKNRGAKDGNLYVTKYPKMPAILVESGFMSNSTELSKIADPNMQSKMAEKIAIGIKDYFVNYGGPVAGPSIDYERYAGTDRYSTNLKISQAGWTTSENVIITTGKDFPDALAASPLTKKYNAPILLTEPKILSSALEKEITRLNAKNAIIVGGINAVSEDIVKKLKTMGLTVTRLSGSDRYETSVAIANHLGAKDNVFVATGANFPDALSIASYAAFTETPIILSNVYNISSNALSYISKSGVSKAYVIGGSKVISDGIKNKLPNPERISGNDRYITNVSIMKKFSADFDVNSVYAATGFNFPDALAGSAIASQTKSPIILVGKSLDSITQGYIQDNRENINKGYVLGGTDVVSNSVVSSLFK